ncbi:SNF2 family N-terminal domain-containing protein [Lipomyces arxii]|uniref:SNF2 family N-terminal domain-containing protein n=1 Tax=Lipomyces arxii TaxID=56418 RepID=UPI0034CFECF4
MNGFYAATAKHQPYSSSVLAPESVEPASHVSGSSNSDRPASSGTFYGSLFNGPSSNNEEYLDRNNGTRRDFNEGRYGIDSLPRSSGSSSNSQGASSSPFPLLFNSANSRPRASSPRSRIRELTKKFANTSNEPKGVTTLSVGQQKGQAVKKLVQRHPAPARPVVVDTELPDPVSFDERKVITRLREVFPTFSNSALLSAVRLKKNFDDAADWLSAQDELAAAAIYSPARSPSPTIVAPVTSKRDIFKPKKSIREKFGANKNVIELSSPVSSTEEVVLNNSRHLKRNFHDVEEDAFLSDSDVESSDNGDSADLEGRVLKIFNTESVAVLADVACCLEEVAKAIFDNRPYANLASVREVNLSTADEVSTGKKIRRPRKAAGDKAVDAALETLSGYEAVDSLIHKCEQLGSTVSAAIDKWGVDTHSSNGELEIVDISDTADTAVPVNGYFTEQPKLMAEDVKLKSYQQVGINWLSLLYKKKLSCILADEMGLGKTCQVIAFLAHLKEIGFPGPHLVVVPSSTLENWLREFKRFCPSFVVEPYYGLQKDRQELRAILSDRDSEFDVIVTTYNLACGSALDCAFLRSFKFNTCIYDEGHLLKNSTSDRYRKLMKLKAEFRLLLTGTPLQNNLQELISLLAFILPHLFRERQEDLASVFKHKAKTTTDSNDANNMALLSQQRISRAKTMMTPFVLRRKKDQVLQHLPKKSHRVEYCELVPSQRSIYDGELAASRRVIEAREAGKVLSKTERASSNILMRLRKAALHPLLFRRYYNDGILRKMAKDIMREERYYDANQQLIYEDMEVMSDFELNSLCLKFRSINQYRLKEEEWMDSGKVAKLREMLVEMKARGDRILIFSQFTQVLDILESVLSTLNMSFLRLDGQTSVEIRQDLIDKFYEEEDITCFLLSTKAGGFGINLACANVVVIFDMSFNPHDDRQAEDRAHRVGQTREVQVVRLVAKDTIEEAILQLANTKLALDKSVSDESDESKMEEQNAALVEKMLFKS